MSYKPNFEQLDNLVEQGYLSKKEDGDLVLYNYSEKCTFEKMWNDHTINSRGTIYSKSTGKVVGQSLKKFFNLGELSPEKQAKFMLCNNFDVFTKEDGSMGTVYFYNDKWNVATRGSFSSEQAIKATEMLDKYDVKLLNQNFTYIVEIIYPENRIIVNYGPKEELILLACFETETGIETDIRDLEHTVFPACQAHKYTTIDGLIKKVSSMTSQEEGFVVKLESGERVKFKSPEYLKVARIITRMSPLTLWESMINGKVSTELMMSIPEEFRDVYEQFQRDLEYNYRMEMKQADERYSNVMIATRESSREELNKSIGIYMSKNENKFNPYVFPILNNKFDNLDKMIMKSIRPTGNIL